jgi:hypothetical protein
MKKLTPTSLLCAFLLSANIQAKAEIPTSTDAYI